MNKVSCNLRQMISSAILLTAGTATVKVEGGTEDMGESPVIAVVAPEPGPSRVWSVGLSADLVSRYVWRGMLQNGDPVVQPSATVTWKEFSLNVWQSWDITSYGTDHYPNAANRGGKIAETDYTLSYSRTILNDKLTLSGGAICYTFPDTFPTTTELYVSAAVNTFLLPTVAVYKDVDESDGLYITPSISYTITFSDTANIVLGASVGWGDSKNNDYYFPGMTKSEDALADYGLSAQLNYSLTPAFVVSPYIKFSDFIDNDIRDQRRIGSYDGDSEQVVAGIRAAFTF